MIGLLIVAGVLGALLDVSLHVLQLIDVPLVRRLQPLTGWITLASALFIGLSLIAQFNAGTLVMDAFIGGLAVFSLVTGKEIE